MNYLDIDELLSAYDADERIRDPIGRISDAFDPLSSLPDPLQSEITLSPSPSLAGTVSPASTEEEAAHGDNQRIPSPSPEFMDSLVPMAETPPDPGPAPPTPPSTIPTTSSVSPKLASSALFSPATVHATPSPSPRALKRRFSVMDLPDQSQGPAPGPSTSRPTKRLRSSFPGESSFQLDHTVAPINHAQSTGQPMGRPREPRPDYSACNCEGGPTSKPARHWRVCPDNPEAGAQPFACEYCDTRFGREDNKKRHIKEYHPEI